MKELKRYDENYNEVEKPESLKGFYESGKQGMLEEAKLRYKYNQAKTADELLPGLVKEVNRLKGIETNQSECRCAYCENFYGKDEDFGDYEGSPVCKQCYINILLDKLNDLKADHKDRIEHALQAQSELMDELVKKDERIKGLERREIEILKLIDAESWLGLKKLILTK